MVLRQAILPGVAVTACVACALAAPGCVPASERIENRPAATAGVDEARPLADNDPAGPAATAGPGHTPTPIRPPTSAIVEPEHEANPEASPAPPAAVASAERASPAVNPPTNPDREAPAQDPTGDAALPPAQTLPAEQTPTQEPAPPAASPDAQPRPEFAPDDKPDSAPPDAPPDAQPEAPPEEEPEEAPPAEPPLHAAWAQDSAYNALFKPDDQVTLAGDIEAVGTFVPAEDAQPGLLLSVKVGEETLAIHGAPLRYLRSIEVRFDFGERLSIAGSWATIDGKRVLLAQAITRGETRVEIRDAETGRPAWVPAPTPAPAPEEGVVEGDNAQPPASVPTG